MLLHGHNNPGFLRWTGRAPMGMGASKWWWALL